MFSSPAIMRSSVDLPQPEGPTSTVNEPSGMSMSTPCSTSTSPKRFFTDRIVTLAMRHDPSTARVHRQTPRTIRARAAIGLRGYPLMSRQVV